ncbi:MAG TPA: HPr kinase/phosphorylase [Pseudorhizobium sp.]|jgi:serine kinase of HPr protein (carbohydrate metabolism regulator)|nr:HPr kinase/phosphorylase [Pseudorhizobium sp.]
MSGVVNVHGTAIVVGQAGLLFVGPSGIGKSAIALQCLATARRAGMFAALVADDQILVAQANGQIIAKRPDSTAGLLEIRGSGIVTIPSVPQAMLDLVVLLVDPTTAERLPPSNETYAIEGVGLLPQIRLLKDHREPMAAIAALCPQVGIPTTL